MYAVFADCSCTLHSALFFFSPMVWWDHYCTSHPLKCCLALCLFGLIFVLYSAQFGADWAGNGIWWPQNATKNWLQKIDNVQQKINNEQQKIDNEQQKIDNNWTRACAAPQIVRAQFNR